MAGLRAGHSYAVRVRPVLELTEEEKALWDLRVLPSVPIVFTTRTCPPSPVKPPLLVSRERRALKVGSDREEEMGVGVGTRLRLEGNRTAVAGQDSGQRH